MWLTPGCSTDARSRSARSLAQGWLYLAVVLDLYQLTVVGWAMHCRMQQALVHAVLEMAVAPRQLKVEVGSWLQILSVRLLGLASATSNRARPFMSGELPRHRRDGDSSSVRRSQAGVPNGLRQLSRGKAGLFDYIRFYKRRRRHLTLGYLSPMAFEWQNASNSS